MDQNLVFKIKNNEYILSIYEIDGHSFTVKIYCSENATHPYQGEFETFSGAKAMGLERLCELNGAELLYI